jgi:hypothetical protein
MPHAVDDLLVLDRRPDPNVLRERPSLEKVIVFSPEPHCSGRTFGEHLEGVPRSLNHRMKHRSNEVARDISVKHITHAVHEDHAGFAPTKRFGNPLRPEAHRKRISTSDVGIDNGEAGPINITKQSSRDGSRVAVVASRAYASAASDRIPRRVGPLNAGLLSHRSPTPEETPNTRQYFRKTDSARVLMRVWYRCQREKEAVTPSHVQTGQVEGRWNGPKRPPIFPLSHPRRMGGNGGVGGSGIRWRLRGPPNPVG